MANSDYILKDVHCMYVQLPIVEKFGFFKAAILQQLHYFLIQTNITMIDGTPWYYSTYPKLSDSFSMSLAQTKRVFEELKTDGVIEIRHFKMTGIAANMNWFTLNYEKLYGMLKQNDNSQNNTGESEEKEENDEGQNDTESDSIQTSVDSQQNDLNDSNKKIPSQDQLNTPSLGSAQKEPGDSENTPDISIQKIPPADQFDTQSCPNINNYNNQDINYLDNNYNENKDNNIIIYPHSNSYKHHQQGKKIEFAEKVLLFQDEYGDLISQWGPIITKAAIDVLNSYKLCKNKDYASDYHTLKDWPLDAAKKKLNHGDSSICTEKLKQKLEEREERLKRLDEQETQKKIEEERRLEAIRHYKSSLSKERLEEIKVQAEERIRKNRTPLFNNPEFISKLIDGAVSDIIGDLLDSTSIAS